MAFICFNNFLLDMLSGMLCSWSSTELLDGKLLFNYSQEVYVITTSKALFVVEPACKVGFFVVKGRF